MCGVKVLHIKPHFYGCRLVVTVGGRSGSNVHLTLSFCFRLLLTVVAVLSSYSIHLLLKSSGIVGTCGAKRCGFSH